MARVDAKIGAISTHQRVISTHQSVISTHCCSIDALSQFQCIAKSITYVLLIDSIQYIENHCIALAKTIPTDDFIMSVHVHRYHLRMNPFLLQQGQLSSTNGHHQVSPQGPPPPYPLQQQQVAPPKRFKVNISYISYFGALLFYYLYILLKIIYNKLQMSK